MSGIKAPPARFWARLAGQLFTSLVATAVGILIAVRLVPDFRLEGSVAQQLSTGLVIAVIFVIGIRLLPILVYLFLLLKRVVRRGERHLTEEPDFGVSDLKFFAPVLGAGFLGFVSVVVTPAVLWLSVWLCGVLGLPVQLSGFWPTVVAALVVAAGRRIPLWLFGLVGPAQARKAAAWALGECAAITGGLLLAVAMLEGVWLESGPGEQQLLTLVVLAVLFSFVELDLAIPLVAAVAAMLLVNSLTLWLLSWFSTGMDIMLKISGFWTLVLVAAIVTIATLPIRIARWRVLRRRFAYDPWPGQIHYYNDSMGGFDSSPTY